VVVMFSVLAVLFIAGRLSPGAMANIQGPDIQQGQIVVVPIQLGNTSYGVAMVDTVLQTLWIYEINSRAAAHNRLRLLAARSWRYDRLLEQYNTAEPKPEQVKALLAKFSEEAQKAESTRQKQEEVLDTNDMKLLE